MTKLEKIECLKEQIVEIYNAPTSVIAISRIHSFLHNLIQDFEENVFDQSDLPNFRQILGSDVLEDSVQGHACRKPYGYSGDFEIIDKFYTYQVSQNPIAAIWDKYLHTVPATKAVRNRKALFIEEVLVLLKLSNNEQFHVLNIGSGPARDVFELFLLHAQHLNNVTIDCVDSDDKAIEFASKLNYQHLDQVNFIRQNILKFRTDKKYDLIWSAGLFDYLQDDVFIRLLARLRHFLKPGGNIIIGNFNKDYNPTRSYMEIFGDWYLIHRSSAELTKLAQEAGFNDFDIQVKTEAENVNLFLHLKGRF